MNAVLYLNNVYYRTIETPDHRPVIHWAVPCVVPVRRYLKENPFTIGDFRNIEFCHCGLGNYHCHVSSRLEKHMRKKRT